MIARLVKWIGNEKFSLSLGREHFKRLFNFPQSITIECSERETNVTNAIGY